MTFALGYDIVAHETMDGAEYGRVYVTPAVDGWTLVLGPWCSPVDPERAADVLAVVRRSPSTARCTPSTRTTATSSATP